MIRYMEHFSIHGIARTRNIKCSSCRTNCYNINKLLTVASFNNKKYFHFNDFPLAKRKYEENETLGACNEYT